MFEKEVQKSDQRLDELWSEYERRDLRAHLIFMIVLASLLVATLIVSLATRPASAGDVRLLDPPGAIRTTGTWSVGARAGDFVYVAGMRGIDPETNTLVQGDEERVRQAFRNMRHVAFSEGARLRDCVRLVVYVTDMARYRPLVNKVQQEMWQVPVYPPRTIVEVSRLNQDDIVEVEGTFYVGKR